MTQRLNLALEAIRTPQGNWVYIGVETQVNADLFENRELRVFWLELHIAGQPGLPFRSVCSNLTEVVTSANALAAVN